MKVAVSTVQNHLDAPVDPRFDRAVFYLIVDTDSLKYESISNPNINAPGGVGIQSAQLVINKGAESVLTGKCGPKAFQVFESSGIEVHENIEGSARVAIKAFRNDKLVHSKLSTGRPIKHQVREEISR